MSRTLRTSLLRASVCTIGLVVLALFIAYTTQAVPLLAALALLVLVVLLLVWVFVALAELIHEQHAAHLSDGRFEVYHVTRRAEQLHGNYVQAFLLSPLGYAFTVRAECNEESVAALVARSMVLPHVAGRRYHQTLHDFVTWLHATQPGFATLLTESGIQAEDIPHIVDWLLLECEARASGKPGNLQRVVLGLEAEHGKVLSYKGFRILKEVFDRMHAEDHLRSQATRLPSAVYARAACAPAYCITEPRVAAYVHDYLDHIR